MGPNIVWKDASTGYEEQRVGRIFNKHRPERFPAGIVKATSIEDVVAGVTLAREKGLKVTVRSGGHSWPAWSLRDGALLIDLENLRELSLDDETNVVTVSPSSTGRMINVDYLSERGRCFPGGHCPSVAVGGFLLQGGQGWNCRGWKWACEYIESMDVVVARQGRVEVVTASETINTDLFWAARGAGLGFFGVVVRFRLKTIPLPKIMAKSILIFEASEYQETFEWFQKTCPSFDLDVELVYLGLSRFRCLPESSGKPDDPLLVISATVWKENQIGAENALSLLQQCPAVKKALLNVPYAPTSFAEEYDLQERDNPPECRFFCNNAWIRGSPEEVADSLRRGFVELPTKDSYTLYYSQGPLRKLPDMAFDIQTEHYFATYLMSTDTSGGEDQLCRNWLAETFAAIDSKRGGPGGSPGQYLGDSDLKTRPARFMSEEHWAKWVRIREKWDPESIFFGYGVHEKGEENRHLWELESRAKL